MIFRGRSGAEEWMEKSIEDSREYVSELSMYSGVCDIS